VKRPLQKIRLYRRSIRWDRSNVKCCCKIYDCDSATKLANSHHDTKWVY